MTQLNADLLKQSHVRTAQDGVIDVVIELNRLDQRLADIAGCIALPEEPTGVPETVVEHLFSMIKITREEHFPELIGLLKSAARATTASLWRAFAKERPDLVDGGEVRLLDGPDEVASYLATQYAQPDQEVVGVLYLDAHHRLIADVELCRGTRSGAVADPRVVLRHGLLRGAVALVLWHTQPDGDSKPSAEDLRITKDLRKAAAVVGLRLVDHIVIGRGGECTSIAGLN